VLTEDSLRLFTEHIAGEQVAAQRVAARLSEIRGQLEIPVDEDGTAVTGCETLRDRWEQEAQALRGYVAGLTGDDLTGTVLYKTTKGQLMPHVRWHLIAAVINHGTQHHSEAAMLLTSHDRAPGDLDLIVFLREGV
jgi:uncharacterized damage-inducible protein DinB